MLCDSVRDAIALQTTDLNYGLQPMAGDSVKMRVLLDHYNQLQLTLEECYAVMGVMGCEPHGRFLGKR